ncbi:hypothetical protein D9M68_714920 [compost metagenome]
MLDQRDILLGIGPAHESAHACLDLLADGFGRKLVINGLSAVGMESHLIHHGLTSDRLDRETRLRPIHQLRTDVEDAMAARCKAKRQLLGPLETEVPVDHPPEYDVLSGTRRNRRRHGYVRAERLRGSHERHADLALERGRQS